MNQVSIDSERLPRGFTPAQQSGAFNTAMAQALAAGDPRYQVKRYDRAGLSRGGAQAHQAGIQGAQDMSEGMAAAYRQGIDDQQYNAMADMNAQASREQFGQALGGLQQQQAYAQQMQMLQRQQAAMGLLKGLIN